ncbi:MAG: hypothetical protein F6K42_26605 [Leptolyngbya sp. SIO1D8]|nr:hypothetical protein [Leptolyngbya sp. SIO1D8]
MLLTGIVNVLEKGSDESCLELCRDRFLETAQSTALRKQLLRAHNLEQKTGISER